jgi:DNA primase
MEYVHTKNKYIYPTTQEVVGLPVGKRNTISCPSGKHRDSTPSFTIYPDGSYYCFGCGSHGANGLSFLIEVLGNSVPESMEYLNGRNLLKKI